MERTETERMAEATREFAIAKTMEILRAYVRKIEDAKGYLDCLSPEGRRIVENYDNNVDGQKTLLLDACNNDKFFLGMTDEMVLAYADVCRKLNDRFDLNVKKVYPIEKITADLSLFEKIKKAIGYSDILGEILEEVGDINALVKQMTVVSGGLIALSFTVYGIVAEALGLALLLVGASFSGTELLAGIVGLVKFFTEVYNAKTEEDLKVCGRLFGDAVAKIGVHGLFFVLSLFGLKKASIRHTTRTIAESKPVSGKWTWKRMPDKKLMVENESELEQLLPNNVKKNRIKPSKLYNADAKPRGKPTKISEKMDSSTKRSLLRENEAAETLAKNGYDIEQNPVVKKTAKNPDYIIEGEIFDCYSPAENTKPRNIASTIEEKVVKNNQTKRVVLNLNDWKGDIQILVKQLKDYPIEGLEEVIVVQNEKIQSIYP